MFKGEDIKKKRKSLGLSAERLAAVLQVSKDNIYKWEKGTRPNNVEDYLKVENWLSGKLENVPQKTVSTGNVQDGLEKTLLEQLMQQMNNLMQTQNNLLRDQKEQVVDKVKDVDINLKRALQGVSKLVLHVESARVVVLDSLSRIEKKPPGSLRKEADKIMDQLEGQQITHDILNDDRS